MARTTLATLAAAAGISLSLALSSPASAIDLSPLQQPSWSELTPQQREVLTPLAGEWDKLESYRRKKWLGIAQRYPSMTADEQKRIQLNMQAWIKLTPAQRQQAREQFIKNLHQAPPERRQVIKQKWQEYSELPDADKERLRQQALHKKAQPKSGAGKSQASSAAKPGILKSAPVTPVPPAPTAPPAALPVPVPAPVAENPPPAQ